MDVPEEPARPARRRRRAVGPPGAGPAGDEPLLERPDPPTDVERLLADRPPHHDRGV